MFVAETIMNRVEDSRYPNNVCDVVYEKKAFSFTHDGKSDNMFKYDTYYDQEAQAIAISIAYKAYYRGSPITTATHYHAVGVNLSGVSITIKKVVSVIMCFTLTTLLISEKIMEKVNWEVTRKSMVSGITRTMTFKVNPEDVKKYADGGLIQNAFPYLSGDDREFIMTGITAEEWDETFGEEV